MTSATHRGETISQSMQATARLSESESDMCERKTTQRWTEMVESACREIESAEDTLSLAQLAERAGKSPHYFHRVFKRETGLTPKAYAAAHRAKRLRAALDSGATVTDAVHTAGYNANDRFYAVAGHRLGMRPTEYRRQGENIRIVFALGKCKLGDILVAQSTRGICAILLGDNAEQLLHDFQDMFARADLIGGDAAFEGLVARVVGFVEQPALGLDLPLDVQGTVFQERVWQALREMAPGETASYSEIARRIGSPRAVRAVASACGANRIAVAIPCHRVVRQDGDVSGYRWGVARKRALLESEGA